MPTGKDLRYMKPLRIALTKGRLEKDTVALFDRMGLDTSAVQG